jgi:hypothetical protein
MGPGASRRPCAKAIPRGRLALLSLTKGSYTDFDLIQSVDWRMRGELFRGQMTAPARWMATQASIFRPTLMGSTRQCMMKGVPSFL